MYASEPEMIEISDFVVPQISKCDVDGNVSKELEGPLVGFRWKAGACRSEKAFPVEVLFFPPSHPTTGGEVVRF